MRGAIALTIAIAGVSPAIAQPQPLPPQPTPTSTPAPIDVDDASRLTTAPERLSLVATAEIELIDVEGAGGFSNREPGLINPRRRAPYLDLDKATLLLGMPLQPRLRATVELRATEDTAGIDRLYLEALAVDRTCWSLKIEAGRQRPMQRPGGRRTESYSPQGAVFWRGREWHLGAHFHFGHGPVVVDAIGSVAMQRELGDEAMGQDPNLPSIAFVNSTAREGSSAELGGLVSASAFGASIAGFGFRGELLDNDGPDRLETTFGDTYRDLGNERNRNSFWWGGRAGFSRFGVHVLAEGIVQRMGLLRRRAFEVGASYTVRFRLFGRERAVEPLVRYGQLTTTNLPEEFVTPESWDREQWVAAILVRAVDSLELKVEYIMLRERTGDDDIADDQVLLQLLVHKDLL